MDGCHEFSCRGKQPDMDEQRKCRPASRCHEDCGAVAHQCVEVATPVRIDVTSKSEGVEIECGRPIICDFSEADCHRKGSCQFVVKQVIDVKIPISYHVNTDVEKLC
jgi:hypothetical protein